MLDNLFDNGGFVAGCMSAVGSFSMQLMRKFFHSAGTISKYYSLQLLPASEIGANDYKEKHCR
ncbi:MAG: hypothetical protein DHS20C01_26440 [marine bacterium B5-7]|nr:MAG: hypothetical protein DHS20C01_26440 [marine bacterium B5-7]